MKAQLVKDLRYLHNLKEEHRLKKQEAEMIKPGNASVVLNNQQNSKYY